MQTYGLTYPFCFLLLCWFAFAATFLLRKKSVAVTETRRDPKAMRAVVLQGIGFGLVWGVRRHLGTPLLTEALNPYLDVLACVLAAGSVALVFKSVQTLGKQWTVAARLVEGHKLVTEGPYGFVRNPIYSGMFGMLLATGLILARWQSFAAAIVISLVATMWRVRVEENLLRGQFGAEFDAYCKKVPSAILPGI